MLNLLHDYTNAMNRLLIREVMTLNEPNTKANTLLSHILNAQHLWNHRIKGEERVYGVWQEHLQEEWMAIQEDNEIITAAILNQTALSKKIAYRNSGGAQFESSIEEILHHLVNHATHHRAQVVQLVSQQLSKPLATDFIFYQRSQL